MCQNYFDESLVKEQPSTEQKQKPFLQSNHRSIECKQSIDRRFFCLSIDPTKTMDRSLVIDIRSIGWIPSIDRLLAFDRLVDDFRSIDGCGHWTEQRSETATIAAPYPSTQEWPEPRTSIKTPL